MRFRNAALCKLKFKTKLWFVGCVMRNSINGESAETDDDAANRGDCDTPWPIKTDIVWCFASIVRKTSFCCCHRCAVVPSFTFMSCAFMCVHRPAQDLPSSSFCTFLLLFAFAILAQQTICLNCQWQCGELLHHFERFADFFIGSRHNNVNSIHAHRLKVCFRYFFFTFAEWLTKWAQADGPMWNVTMKTLFTHVKYQQIRRKRKSDLWWSPK